MSVDSPFGYGYDLSLNWKQTEALRDWVTALGALPEHQGPSKATRFRAVTVSPEPSQGWTPFGSFCSPGGASRRPHPFFVVTGLLVLKSAHRNPVKTAIPQRVHPIDSLTQWRVLLGPSYPREKPQSWWQRQAEPADCLRRHFPAEIRTCLRSPPLWVPSPAPSWLHRWRPCCGKAWLFPLSQSLPGLSHRSTQFIALGSGDRGEGLPLQTEGPLQLLVGLGRAPEPAHPHGVVTESSNAGDTAQSWPRWHLAHELNLG